MIPSQTQPWPNFGSRRVHSEYTRETPHTTILLIIPFQTQLCQILEILKFKDTHRAPRPISDTQVPSQIH
jgi:hypothetical protein